MPKNAGDIVTAPGEALIQVFTAPGTWNKPDGVRAVRVRVQAAGGGSGGCTGAGTGNSVSGGGAGGGYSEAYISAANLLNAEAVTVGVGGVAGTPGGTGGTGGSSAFGAHCSATGGAGGGSMTSATVTTQAAGGLGGAGSGGDINIPGGDGPNGFNAAGVAIRNGVSGSSVLGGGQRLSTVAATPGTGKAYGGGAAPVWATSVNSNGGVGGNGVVIVESVF